MIYLILALISKYFYLKYKNKIKIIFNKQKFFFTYFHQFFVEEEFLFLRLSDKSFENFEITVVGQWKSSHYEFLNFFQNL